MSRKYRLQRYYGITEEQYEARLKEQKGRCFICHKPAKYFKHSLNVDHDHVTGEIRGLLCAMCNHKLIGRHRDPLLFYRAYKYLKQGTGWFVPNEFLKGVPKKRRRKRKKTK
jgi:hypothetical protein